MPADEGIDLTVPRPVRFLAYDADGQVIKAFEVGAELDDDTDQPLAPRQLAQALLHADAIARVQIFDLVTDDLLIDRSEPDGGDKP